jgi:hypothetical protein
MDNLTVHTGLGSLKIKGEHMVLTFLIGIAVGAVILFRVQKSFNVFIPKN